MAMGGWGSVAVANGRIVAVLMVEGSSHGDRILPGGQVEYSLPAGRPYLLRAFQMSAKDRTPVRVFLRTGSGEYHDMGLYAVIRAPRFPGERALLRPLSSGAKGADVHMRTGGGRAGEGRGRGAG